ncbi:putative sir2 family histone protein [Paramyrothecium foliicola]|nr:putative sir2 family histone protein [Paramyrothecium foliicola]
MSFYSRRPLWMRHTPYALASAPSTSIADLKPLVESSSRLLVLCGAGLSASSGILTFRGAGGLWRNRASTSLATAEAFENDPALVWLFYAWRKHAALTAVPNPGHYALAELAKKKEGVLCLTQNIDGLSSRAGHPRDQLKLLHGSLFDLKCFDGCGYEEKDNVTDPPCDALAIAVQDYPPNGTTPLLDPTIPVPIIRREDLPHCPQCRTGLLRPGIVWFGESLDQDMLTDIDNWIQHPKQCRHL